MNIIERLARNAEKQQRYRMIIRGRAGATYAPYHVRKRIADILFLYKYAGWRKSKLARHFGVSPERIRQIVARADHKNPSICHPRGSCLLGSIQ